MMEITIPLHLEITKEGVIYAATLITAAWTVVQEIRHKKQNGYIIKGLFQEIWKGLFQRSYKKRE